MLQDFTAVQRLCDNHALRTLDLRLNPLSRQANYRLHIAHILPWLQCLGAIDASTARVSLQPPDERDIRQSDRTKAVQLFGPCEGAAVTVASEHDGLLQDSNGISEISELTPSHSMLSEVCWMALVVYSEPCVLLLGRSPRSRCQPPRTSHRARSILIPARWLSQSDWSCSI